MVKRLIKIAEKAKSILFADPNLLYKEERHLVNQPFFFEGTNGKGVLLIHGWTSTPYELRRLGTFLNENGYTVYGLQLTGHGTVPKDLENTEWQQWKDDVRKGYEDLKRKCEKVFVAGTSIGGSLAIILGAEEKEVAGLVLMATPYKMRKEIFILFFLKILLKMKKKYRKKFYPPTFGVSTTITRLISYQTYPVASVLEVQKAVSAARESLPKITQPCLVMQSTHDHIIIKDSIDRIYDGVNSKVKKKKHVEKAYHTFISDIKNEHVFEDIMDFIEKN